MSVYHGKLLELLSIDEQSEKTFLRIRLTFENDVELLWEIDTVTADKLKAVTVFNENDKYRLSLQSPWKSNTGQHVSFLTKTYREQSERIYFSCTKEYV